MYLKRWEGMVERRVRVAVYISKQIAMTEISSENAI